MCCSGSDRGVCFWAKYLCTLYHAFAFINTSVATMLTCKIATKTLHHATRTTTPHVAQSVAAQRLLMILVIVPTISVAVLHDVNHHAHVASTMTTTTTIVPLPAAETKIADTAKAARDVPGRRTTTQTTAKIVRRDEATQDAIPEMNGTDMTVMTIADGTMTTTVEIREIGARAQVARIGRSRRALPSWPMPCLSSRRRAPNGRRRSSLSSWPLGLGEVSEDRASDLLMRS